jgi:hypothetical protein
MLNVPKKIADGLMKMALWHTQKQIEKKVMGNMNKPMSPT